MFKSHILEEKCHDMPMEFSRLIDTMVVYKRYSEMLFRGCSNSR